MGDNRHFRHPAFKVALEGFAFELPPGWEITSYSLVNLLTAGRLSFASEDGPQGQFSWRTVKAVPDIPRIIEEIHRRHLGEDAPPKIRFTRHGHDGRVILAHTRYGERFYASVFNLRKMFLCEWTFPKYTKENADIVVPMLDSFADNAPDEKTGRMFFALFGLEVSVPQDYHLDTVEPYPAAVTMIFENRKHYRIEAHRYGMADICMEGAGVLSFYHRCLYAKRYSIAEKRAVVPYSGFETAEIEFRTRGRIGFDMLLGPWWKGFGCAFLKPQENRICAYEHIASRFLHEREKVKDIFPQKS